MNGSQPYARASRSTPGAALRCKRFGMVVDELLLLVWCEVDHSELLIRMDRREDPSFDAEVGMTHVHAFDRALHSQWNAAEVIRAHSCQP